MLGRQHVFHLNCGLAHRRYLVWLALHPPVNPDDFLEISGLQGILEGAGSNPVVSPCKELQIFFYEAL